MRRSSFAILERRTGLEPVRPVWRTGMLPTTSAAHVPPRDCRADIGGILGKERKRERFGLGIAFRLCLILFYHFLFVIFVKLLALQKFIVLPSRILFIALPYGKRHLLPTQAINIPQRQNHAHLCILNAIYVPI